MQKKFEITSEELIAIVQLYQLANPYMTTARIYSRWKVGKLNLLIDYKLWSKADFDQLMKEQNANKKAKKSHRAG